MHRLGSFVGFKILNFNIFGVLDIFGVLYLGVISCILVSFLKVKEWGIFFGVAKISNIFGVLEIPDIFWG